MAWRLLLTGLLGVAAVYLIGAWGIPMDPFTAAEPVNARTLPLVYGALFGACVMILLARNPAPSPPRPARGPVLQMLALLLLLVAFVGVIHLVPLWFGLGGLLVAGALVLGERRPVPLTGMATLVPLAGYVVVEVFLGVRLPG